MCGGGVTNYRDEEEASSWNKLERLGLCVHIRIFILYYWNVLRHSSVYGRSGPRSAISGTQRHATFDVVALAFRGSPLEPEMNCIVLVL
jgi:hypothetical protein